MSLVEELSTEELAQGLAGDDGREVTAFSNELVRRGARDALPQLRRVFETTSLPIVRNALALALTDLHDPGAFDIIVRVMKTMDASPGRGTLLYALRDQDCAPIFPLLVEIVITGNWEESREALHLTDTIDAEIDSATFARCRTLLEEALATASDERRPVIAELLSGFGDR